MSLTLGDNFSYQGAKPLDARLKYDTIAAMVAMADSTLYDGCMAYCVATEKTYQWKSTNTVDETLGKWREFSSGGSGGTSDYTQLSNLPQINGVELVGNKSTSDLGISYDDISDTPTIPTVDQTYSASSTNAQSGVAVASAVSGATGSFYSTSDSASTDLADADYVPFYDSSASTKKKSLWSNIKAVLKSYFDGIYQKALTAGTNIGISGTTISATNTISLNFSTSEQAIGKWIDGKTLYQKTVTCTTPSSTSTWGGGVSLGTNCVIVDVINAYVTHSGNWKIPIPWMWPNGSSGTLGLAYMINSNGSSAVNGQVVLFNFDSGYVSKSCTLTLRYTK